MAKTEQTAQILVAGTGPAGLIASPCMAEAGFAVTLAGRRCRHDRGTTALMNPALKVLDRLGIWMTHAERRAVERSCASSTPPAA